MNRIATAAVVVIAGLAAAPAFAAHEPGPAGWRAEREIRAGQAEVRRWRAELERDLRAYHRGARNGREIAYDRRMLAQAERELARDLRRYGRR
jgi:hypothetical protein